MAVDEPNFIAQSVRSERTLSTCANRFRAGRRTVSAGPQGGSIDLSGVPFIRRSDPKGKPLSLLADGADRAEGRAFAHRGGAVPMPAMQPLIRGVPPFARPYVGYTRKLEKFVDRLSRVMTLRDAADLAGLGWDAAKDI